ncbi:MarR family winged helix-turn-helix transcriptional regulator [Alkaliphilus peptidifermentans]|uniref:DNA-binding transcriptional regulator, MarR family n=1 Tax=Alkaliphilus peptidifermentans DSM 18978 TaxID=1120976 RepID=A0A1G5IDC0_9FIRM|nr:MarR family transcriptional regulator [Alkaliphilus peptidifermentans]SCY73751.1 DNA-binding transcriptional regulator, MarR family [Alkaliphilus peptidifermentans DSM 18978]
MRNYYLQIHEYVEKLVLSTMVLDKKGIKYNGDTFSFLELFILKLLGDQQEKKMYEIIEELDIDRNTMNTAINRLYFSKYLTKKKSEDDKRVQILQLTERGKITFEQVISVEKEILFSLLNDFTFNEEKAILKFLVKIDMLSKKTDSK